MRKLVTGVTVALVLVLAGVAAAAAGGGQAVLQITPNQASASAAVMFKVTDIMDIPALPTSFALTFPRGSTASATSVATLCTAAQAKQAKCPGGSQVGTGSYGVTSLGTVSTFPTRLYLGHRLHTGDIASVYTVLVVDGIAPEVIPGRLLRTGGKLEFLVRFLPTPKGAPPLTFNSFRFALHAVRTVSTGTGRHRHRMLSSLITAPSACTGSWTAVADINYPGGSDVLPLSSPCRAR